MLAGLQVWITIVPRSLYLQQRRPLWIHTSAAAAAPQQNTGWPCWYPMPLPHGPRMPYLVACTVSHDRRIRQPVKSFAAHAAAWCYLQACNTWRTGGDAHRAAKRRVRSLGAVPRRTVWLPMEPCSGTAGNCLGAADVAGAPAGSSSSSASPSMRLSSRPPRKPAPLPEAPAALGPLCDLSTAASATWLQICSATNHCNCSGINSFSHACVGQGHLTP